MNIPLSPKERVEIAAMAGINEQYLYQCLTGRKAMKVPEAVRVERVSGQRVRRWHLRLADWHECWPELIGTEGAPVAPTEEARHAA